MAAKPIFVQAVDTNGTPYSGAKLNVYDAGTTTPRAIYTESGLGTASANPAIADANGVLVVWVNDAGGDIKVTLTNSAETVTPHNEDNVPIASLTCYPVITFQGDQSLLTTSSPTFAGLTLGNVSFAGVVTDPNADRLVFWDDSAGQVNFMTLGTGLAFNGTALELDGDLQDISGLTPTDGGVIIGDGTDFVVESGATLRTSIGVAIGSDVQAWDADLDVYAANPLTAAELGELQNIGSTTINATQWGYVGGLDQALASTNSPTFVTVTSTSSVIGGVTVSPSGATIGQALGFPTSTGTLEPYTPAGGGDTLAAANETISGDWNYTGAPTLAGSPLVSRSATETLTNKTLTSPVLNGTLSGTGISQYAYAVDTIAELKALTGGVNEVVEVKGHTAAGDGGGGIFYWDAADTTTDDNGIYIQPNAGGTGRWVRRFNGAVNILWYGAAVDGVTDDASKVQAASDYVAANGGGVVSYPAGSVRIASQIDVTASNVRHVGSGIGSTLIDVNSNSAAAFLFQGTRETGEGNTLASNADQSDVSISLSTGKGSNFAADDWAIIIDEGTIPDTLQKQGEIVRVKSVASDTVTFYSPLRYSYTTANSAQLQRLDMLTGCGVENMSLKKTTPASSTAGLAVFIHCHSPSVRRVEAYDNAQQGFSFFGCVGHVVSDCVARDLLSNSGSSYLGYGVQEGGANLGGRIAVSAERVRHAYTTINSGSVLPYGVPTGTVIQGTAVDTHLASWDTHEEAQSIVFNACTAQGSGQSGFQVRGKDCQVLGGSAERCIGPGVFIPNSAADTIVSDVALRLTNLGTDADSIDWTNSGAIEDRGERTTVSGGFITESGGPGINAHSDARDPFYRDTRMVNPCRITTTVKDGVSILGTATNTARVDSMLVTCSDTRMDYGVRVSSSAVEAFVTDTKVSGAQVDRISLNDAHNAWGNEANGPLNLGAQEAFTISSGAIDISDAKGGAIAVDPESAGVADDLDTITGGRQGQWISIRRNTGTTITLKHNTGNILTSTAADVPIDSSLDLFLMYKSGSNWVMLRNS